jgi:hypothetical protein
MSLNGGFDPSCFDALGKQFFAAESIRRFWWAVTVFN